MDATAPLLILALPRSFSSITCAMLGQHPQLYGFPELHLFSAERMTEWMHVASRSSFSMEHGLLRSLAELLWGEQTERTVRMARGWMMRHRDFTTGMMFETLASKVYPRIPVEKGPTLASRLEYMQRAYRLYPNARFIHLVRSPLGYCSSVLRLIQEEQAQGKISRWLLEILYYPYLSFDESQFVSFDMPRAQLGWHELNAGIRRFLKTVPPQQQMLLRGEELLCHPDRTLKGIAKWLGIRCDAAAIEAMKHPEKSPYASYGPEGARNGFDPHFLQSPALRPVSEPHEAREQQRSAGVLDSATAALAVEFGYRIAGCRASSMQDVLV